MKCANQDRDQIGDPLWWNQPPAARMSGFANAWVNSGCGTVAADWTQRQSAASALTLHLKDPFALAWDELDLEWAGRMLTWGDENEV